MGNVWQHSRGKPNIGQREGSTIGMGWDRIGWDGMGWDMSPTRTAKKYATPVL